MKILYFIAAVTFVIVGIVALINRDATYGLASFAYGSSCLALFEIHKIREQL